MPLLLIVALILFILLIVFHEFGHFIVAKRNSVEVEEFGLGFPPRAKVLGTKNGTVYSVNWLPLGGFVKLKGEHDSATGKGSYGAASLWAKVKIMLAGVVMNLVAAFVLLTFLALVGIPKLIDNQFTVKSDTKVSKQEVLVAYVEPGSPAEKAGLKTNDQIVSLGDAGSINQVESAEKLPDITKQFAGQKVDVKYLRDKVAYTGSTTLRSKQEVEDSQKNNQPKGYLGISPSDYLLRKSTWSAPLVALGLMKQFTLLTYKGLGSAVSGLFHGHASQASAQVSGPVGIFVLLKDGSVLGYQFIIMIIAVISLTLALINVLPIPALDGGRLFVTLLFRAIKIPITERREDMIHGTGFLLLMLLFVVITVVDVKRLF